MIEIKMLPFWKTRKRIQIQNNLKQKFKNWNCERNWRTTKVNNEEQKASMTEKFKFKAVVDENPELTKVLNNRDKPDR